MKRSTIEPFLPVARRIRLQARYMGARRKASSSRNHPFRTPPVFVIGCGRSGTTILGTLLQSHPQSHYLFEPYHLWTAVDSRTDMLHLFQNAPAACSLSADDATPEIAQRFNALFGRLAASSPSHVLIEKTPINALRISYLDAIAPGCKFIHIVRDGVDVAHSIARLTGENSYRIAGKPHFNQWWGENDVKWRLLARDGASLGYHPFEAPQLQSNEQRGAYEWLVSLHEANRFRSMLGSRMLDVRYSDLTESPRETLSEIAAFTGLGARRDWLAVCEAHIDASRSPRAGATSLPAPMAEDFNALQKQFGFHGFAIPESSVKRVAEAASGKRIAPANPAPRAS